MRPIYRNLPTTTQAMQKDKKVQRGPRRVDQVLAVEQNAFTAIR